MNLFDGLDRGPIWDFLQGSSTVPDTSGFLLLGIYLLLHVVAFSI